MLVDKGIVEFTDTYIAHQCTGLFETKLMLTTLDRINIVSFKQFHAQTQTVYNEVER